MTLFDIILLVSKLLCWFGFGFAIFVYLMFKWDALNRWVARYIVRAPDNLSFSGNLWRLDEAGNWFGKHLRPWVDDVAFEFSKNHQTSHCQKAYIRDMALLPASK